MPPATKPPTIETVPAIPKLKAWMAGPPRVTQDEVVERLKERGVTVSQQAVSSWLCSHARCDSDIVKAAFEKLTGGAVVVADWRTEAERAAFAKLDEVQDSATDAA
jgi:hypothetical protein